MDHVHYHFIGIGGIGMSALARILLEEERPVSGSDLYQNQVVNTLQCRGASVVIGHHADNVVAGATVIYSSDIPKDNPELCAAKAKQCLLMHRSELLAELMRGKQVLAVAGTHGKTGTSSLLTHVLRVSGLDPSFALGGIPLDIGANGGRGCSPLFVAEADESDGSFLNYSAYGAIVTNIGSDHIAHYGTFDKLTLAFATFIASVEKRDLLFFCGDDPLLRSLAQGGIAYGFGKECALRASRYRAESGRIFFDVDFDGRRYADVEVALMGRHQALNALAVFGLALRLGANVECVRQALASYRGSARRCERKLEREEFLLLDDYGHHPTEVKATLEGIREAIGERRLIILFQPHRYSRIATCHHDFARAFESADQCWITDLYAAGEQPLEGISAQLLLSHIRAEGSVPAMYVPRDRLLAQLKEYLRPHDVLVCMGAGDITKVAAEVADHFRERALQKYVVGVIKGGKNSEHEISLLSAANVTAGLNTAFYEIRPFSISKEGRWHSDEALSEQVFSKAVLDDLTACDLFVPVLHGPLGEDGVIAGFLETLGKPYVGCDHRSSAVCMDKGMLKRLLLSEGIATTPFISLSYLHWQSAKEELLEKIFANLAFPLFVKPAHLGSSVGVRQAQTREELVGAIDNGFKFDTDLLVEQGLSEIREVEFAVLGNRTITVPLPGEIDTRGAVYDYRAKYGPDGMKTIIPAPMAPEIAEEGRAIAGRAYAIAGCSGLARVDTFLDSSGKYWINEINPFPGFTSISLYPKVWEHLGVPLPKLLDRLVVLGLARKRTQDRFVRTLISIDEA